MTDGTGPGSRRALRVERWVLVLALAGLGAATAATWTGLRTIREGEALFNGDRALPARLAMHDDPLPAHATRCLNCHAGAQAVGPALNRRTLAQAVPRRGGPASAYDANSLCRLLRTGIDPSWVQLDKGMPRYTVTDSECEALWRFLGSR